IALASAVATVAHTRGTPGRTHVRSASGGGAVHQPGPRASDGSTCARISRPATSSADSPSASSSHSQIDRAAVSATSPSLLLHPTSPTYLARVSAYSTGANAIAPPAA